MNYDQTEIELAGSLQNLVLYLPFMHCGRRGGGDLTRKVFTFICRLRTDFGAKSQT